MIVIALTPNVATDAELTALTGKSNQDIVYHSGDGFAYMFRTNIAVGNLQADDLSGWWVKESGIECLNLAEYKSHRINEINERTAELIKSGYTWAGKQFPLSQNGQINLLGMVNACQLGIMAFPVDLNTINDEERHSIADATEVYNIFGTALGTKKYYLDSGTALKEQIMNAIDEAAVQLIIDNR